MLQSWRADAGASARRVFAADCRAELLMNSAVSTPDAFAAAVAALGRAAFASELLAALNRSVPVDHICLMRVVDRERPPVLESASWRGGMHVAEVQRAYLNGMYRFDPNLSLAPRAGVAVLHLRRDAIARADYRKSCFVRAGLLERLTVAAADEGQLVLLNLYRLDASGRFAANEIAAIESLSRFLGALAVKHVGTLGMLLRSRDRADRIGALAARLHALDGRLTLRERDVLSRVMLGVTSEGIALDLGIGLNTVLTYRKRAYARLGVTSQAELFSLCL
jgi:DNA-binding CsgD family transcriptional regulator